MTKFRSLCAHLMPDIDAARWAEAVIIRESDGNPDALGDNGRAIGIMQQHAEFQHDYHPVDCAASGKVEPEARGIDWLPAFQIGCFAFFWRANLNLTAKGRVIKYHLGHVDDTDPDGYGYKVETIRSGL
jgi:hypothetical protein